MKKKLDNIDAGRKIKVDIYSRPNATNGKYKAGQLGLDDLVLIQGDDIFCMGNS